MSVVSAFLVPGSPLPLVKRDNPCWGELASAMEAAGERLRASKPDAVLLYSTQWLAVLDELWQTRERSTGVHVDENWHEYGDLPFDIRADHELAEACVAAVTSAVLRVVPMPARRDLVVFFFASVEEALQATVEIADLEPAAIEHLDDAVDRLEPAARIEIDAIELDRL